MAHRNVAGRHPELVKQLDARRLRWSQAQQRKADVLTPEIPRPGDEERKQLRALGYTQ